MHEKEKKKQRKENTKFKLKYLDNIMRRKFDIKKLSPGIENTQRYGNAKYSSTQDKYLNKLFEEFQTLNLLSKTKKYDKVIIPGKNRNWTIEPPIEIIEGKKRNFTTKKIVQTCHGKNRVWTLKKSKKKKKKRKKKIIK